MLTEEIYSKEGVLTGRAFYYYRGEKSLGWKHEDIFNKTTVIYEIEYDEKGNLITEKRTINDMVDYYVERKYNNNNLIIEEEEFSRGSYNEPNNLLFHEFIYKFFD